MNDVPNSRYLAVKVGLPVAEVCRASGASLWVGERLLADFEKELADRAGETIPSASRVLAQPLMSSDQALKTSGQAQKSPEQARRSPDRAQASPDQGHPSSDLAQASPNQAQRSPDQALKTSETIQNPLHHAQLSAGQAQDSSDQDSRHPDQAQDSPDQAQKTASLAFRTEAQSSARSLDDEASARRFNESSGAFSDVSGPSSLHRLQDRDFSGVSTDSRHIFPEALFIALSGERFDGADYVPDAVAKGASGAVVESSRARELSKACGEALILAVDSPLRALGLLASWHRNRMPAKVIAITGSNGKTTTKEFIKAAFAKEGPVLATQGNLNNEIGAPLTLLALRPEHRVAVIELGMSGEGEIARLTQIARPDVGVVTNVAAVHLAGLGSLEAVSRAKGELFHGLPLSAAAVANLDDEQVAERARKADRRTWWFGQGENADFRLLKVISHDEQGLHFRAAVRNQEVELRLPVVGLHNAMNALAALAAAVAAGMEPQQAALGLENIQPPERRLQRIPLPGGAGLLDDCYNAAPESLLAALRTLEILAPEGQRLAVLGDMRELGPDEDELHRQAGQAAAGSGLRLLVAVGELARNLAQGAVAAGMPKERVFHTLDPEEAAATVRNFLSPGSWVLVKASRGMRLERVSEALLKGDGLASGSGASNSGTANTGPSISGTSTTGSSISGTSKAGPSLSGASNSGTSTSRSSSSRSSKSGSSTSGPLTSGSSSSSASGSGTEALPQSRPGGDSAGQGDKAGSVCDADSAIERDAEAASDTGAASDADAAAEPDRNSSADSKRDSGAEPGDGSGADSVKNSDPTPGAGEAP